MGSAVRDAAALRVSADVRLACGEGGAWVGGGLPVARGQRVDAGVLVDVRGGDAAGGGREGSGDGWEGGDGSAAPASAPGPVYLSAGPHTAAGSGQVSVPEKPATATRVPAEPGAQVAVAPPAVMVMEEGDVQENE